jgi:hypothetical protein
MTCAEIFNVLDPEVNTMTGFERALITEYPTRSSIVERAFDKYLR